MKVNGNLEGKKTCLNVKNYGKHWEVVKGLNMHTTGIVFKW